MIDHAPDARFPRGQYDADLQAAMNAMGDRVANAVNAVADLQAQGGASTGPGATTRPPAAEGVTAKVPRATTRPLDAEGDFPLPDLSAVAGAMAARSATTRPTTGPTTEPSTEPTAGLTPAEAVVRRELIESLADLARLHIYFARRPDAAAPMMAALRQVLPAGDPLLAQLQGWADLVAGHDKAARDALLTIAKDDPLGQLGIAQLMAKDQPEQADEIGRKLLSDHPDGLVGAMVADGLAGRHLRVAPPAVAVPLKQVAQRFPQQFALGVQNPTSLYQLHFEPVDTKRDVGQPLLAEVTITNFAPVDLTIGPDGFLHRGMLFQAVPLPLVAGGAPPKAFPAFDEWAGPMVLPRQSQVRQTVRLDQQAGLLVALEQSAGQMVQVDAQVQTNPDAPLGGYGVRMTTKFARAAVTAQRAMAAQQTLAAAIGPGASNPADRVTAVGVLQVYAKQLRAVRNPPANVVQMMGGDRRGHPPGPPGPVQGRGRVGRAGRVRPGPERRRSGRPAAGDGRRRGQLP